jgi:hypothetical protein
MYFLYKNEYRIFKPVQITRRRRLREKEKNRGDEPMQVIIHIYMEITQGNSLCSYLKQTEMSVLKNREQGGKTGPVWGLAQVEGEDIRKVHRKVNMVEYYVLMYENGKMRPAETIPGKGRDKGE